MSFCADIFDQDRLFFFWKGRIALYTILKAMNIKDGDEVIIPGYTCVVVANAVIYLGATPIYVDIDPLTYNITPETIEPRITTRTKVIIAQNTFGLSPDLDAIMALAQKYGLYVVEDCAHGLGGSYRGRPAGTNTHAAFFSTQWSKPITTGLGGIGYVSDDDLLPKVAALMTELSQPGRISELILAGQRLVRPLANDPHLYYSLLEFYRFVTQKMGLSVGSSVGDELTNTKMPEYYLRRMGRRQRQSLDKITKSLDERVRKRQAVAKKFDALLDQNGLIKPYQPTYAEHAMLRYTIRVRDKTAILHKAQQLHIPIGDWFISPLHPVEGDLSPWSYQEGQCPEAEKACNETINLLTDQEISKENLVRLFDG